MSKPVLIGVGGSGQHVVHAYLQLLALSDAPISKIPHVYIIDADAKESTDHPKDSPLTASIRHLHKSLVSPLKDDLEPECRLIRPYFQEHNEIPSKSAISLGVVDTSQPLAHALLMNEEDVDLNDKEVKIGAADLSPILEGAISNQGKVIKARTACVSLSFKMRTNAGMTPEPVPPNVEPTITTRAPATL